MIASLRNVAALPQKPLCKADSLLEDIRAQSHSGVFFEHRADVLPVEEELLREVAQSYLLGEMLDDVILYVRHKVGNGILLLLAAASGELTAHQNEYLGDICAYKQVVAGLSEINRGRELVRYRAVFVDALGTQPDSSYCLGVVERKARAQIAVGIEILLDFVAPDVYDESVVRLGPAAYSPVGLPGADDEQVSPYGRIHRIAYVKIDASAQKQIEFIAVMIMERHCVFTLDSGLGIGVIAENGVGHRR